MGALQLGMKDAVRALGTSFCVADATRNIIQADFASNSTNWATPFMLYAAEGILARAYSLRWVSACESFSIVPDGPLPI